MRAAEPQGRWDVLIRLDKTQRHALRRWVRAHPVITERELAVMQPASYRVVRAEMRKRWFEYDMFDDAYNRRGKPS